MLVDLKRPPQAHCVRQIPPFVTYGDKRGSVASPQAMTEGGPRNAERIQNRPPSRIFIFLHRMAHSGKGEMTA